MINIKFNGENISIESNLSIQALLLLDVAQIKNVNAIAVVVNERILPRSKWTDTTCQENDQIEVFKAVAGG
ncbi:thiamine biosynthesis protein ThiS [Shewanella sp. OPT22]|nr:thiamine biosynthesis protein ThiS [Shewanella sp. OPT22]